MGIYEKWFYADGWPRYNGFNGRDWAEEVRADIEKLETDKENLKAMVHKLACKRGGVHVCCSVKFEP